MPITVADTVMAYPSQLIHVAVGVITDTQQNILIALRPDHADQGGLWEFPGGKLESTETVEQALQRELFEELGIQSVGMRPLIQVKHDYSDKTVLLDVWWVDRFKGEAQGKEGQPIRWVSAEQLAGYRFPEANEPIVKAIQLAMGVTVTALP